MFGKRKNPCIYREKEVVIVTCPDCDKPRLIQHRSHWGNTIPKVRCKSCSQKKVYERRQPTKKLKDFDEMLDVLEIVKSFFTPETPLMVKTTVNAMLREYNRGV